MGLGLQVHRDLDQRREKMDGLHAQLRLEEEHEMRSSPQINAHSRRLARTDLPVVERLAEQGKQSAQRLEELRQFSWEHDTRTGQRLYQPKLATSDGASDLGAEPDDQSIASQRTIASQASRRRTDELYSKALEQAERQRVRRQDDDAALAELRRPRLTGRTSQLAAVRPPCGFPSMATCV